MPIKSSSTFVRTAAVLVTALAVGLFAPSAIVAKSDSLSKEMKIHYQIISQTPLYNDPKLNELVQRVGAKVGRNSNEPGVDYKFFILDSPGINAFTPGYGRVYVNRGLLALMVSEGQLAALLAHEIAHNTERHISRQKTLGLWDNLASIASLLLTGSSSIGNAIKTSNAARNRSFGREMELEADGRGAEYMYRANYDPDEMLGLMSILKDHERFNDLRSLNDGGDVTYHGVFSTHPRSDKRLRELIASAGTLPPGESFRGRAEMREALTGVVVGNNFNGNKVQGYERFTHKGLGITFLYPEDWKQTTKGKDIILKDPNKTVQLKLTVEKSADKTLASKEILSNKYQDDLSDVRPIHKVERNKKSRNSNRNRNRNRNGNRGRGRNPSSNTSAVSSKDLGTTARRPQQRVAAITVGRNTFHFQGIAKNNQLSDAQDHRFVEIIETFRRATQRDLPPTELRTIYFERWEPGMTFTELAAGREMGTFTEEHLRLMNGYFPKGEPEPGMWVKRVKLGPPLDKQELAKQKGE